jgi:hypothetical protein
MALTFEVPSLRDNWRRAALVSLAVLVCAGVVVALVQAGGGSRSASRDASSSTAGGSLERSLAAPATTVAPAAMGAGTSSADQAASAPSAVPLSGPKIIRTAELQVRVKRGTFASAVDRVTSIAASAGGFVSTTSTSSFAKGEANGELALRVPAARFDDVRRALARLGTLESLELGGDDVGGQLVDLGARLKTLRAEEGSLDVLLSQARDIGQILQVRDRLTGVRTEIEQLAGQQAALEDQVALATIRVSLHEPAAKATTTVAHDDRSGFGDSVGTAVDAMVAVVGGMVIVLGVALPFLLLALLAVPFVLRYRRRAAA